VDLGIGLVAGQEIDLSEQPSRISEAVTKSASLIDPRNTTRTWARAGLILGVPPEDVIITSPHDVGAVHGDRQKMRELWGERYPDRLTPEELLAQSGPIIHNEVVVATERAVVLGFFTKTHPTSGVSLAPALAEKLSRHATDLDVPMIEIPLQIQPGSYPPYRYH
jgi:hypothetical protein